MHIITAADRSTFASMAAWRLAAQILAKPNATLALPTGDTAAAIYEALVAIHAAHPFDVSQVCLFGTYEFLRVDRALCVTSYDTLLRQVVSPLGVYLENLFMPMPFSDDPHLESLAYDAVTARRFGIDLQLLDIGADGSLGLLAPGTPFGSSTGVFEADEAEQLRVRKEAGLPENTPICGISRGIVNIMHSRKLLLVACGQEKAEIVRQALEGPVCEAVPASVVQLHPSAEVMLDAQAACLLRASAAG